MDALAESIQKIWNENDINEQLKRVFQKARDILTIIVKNDGSIKNCETDFRGLKRNELVLTEEDRQKLQKWGSSAGDVTSEVRLCAIDYGSDGNESEDEL